jgi:hypothetical protein
MKIFFGKSKHFRVVALLLSNLKISLNGALVCPTFAKPLMAIEIEDRWHAQLPIAFCFLDDPFHPGLSGFGKRAVQGKVVHSKPAC